VKKFWKKKYKKIRRELKEVLEAIEPSPYPIKYRETSQEPLREGYYPPCSIDVFKYRGYFFRYMTEDEVKSYVGKDAYAPYYNDKGV
jgi:hypothetical protein